VKTQIEGQASSLFVLRLVALCPLSPRQVRNSRLEESDGPHPRNEVCRSPRFEKRAKGHSSGGVGAPSPLLPWLANIARWCRSSSLTRSASVMTTPTPTLTCVWLGLSANRLLYFPTSHCLDCIPSLARLIASRVGSSASEMSTSSSAQTSAHRSRARVQVAKMD
jgi:hypothetical protein